MTEGNNCYMSKVTMNVLIKRINRVLKKQDECLRVLRGNRYLNDLGRYYIVDFGMNLMGQDVDPEVIGREFGVLKASEQVV